MMDLGAWIRTKRKENGLSQGELAEQVGSSQTIVSNWERGQSRPSAEVVATLEALFGAPPFGSGGPAPAPRDTTRRTAPPPDPVSAPAFPDRERLFSEAVNRAAGATSATRWNKAYGVSNSAKVIDGGIQLAVLNMERFDGEADGYVLTGVMRFAPSDEVLFALSIRSGIRDLLDRLEEMKLLGGASADEADSDDGGLRYSMRNNNVVAYLGWDGCLYLRNKGFWDALPSDLSQAGASIHVDAVFTATSSRGVLGNGAREYIAYLARMADERWVPLFPWRNAGTWDAELSARSQQSSVLAISGSDALDRVVRHVAASHGYADPSDDPWLFVDPTDSLPASIAEAAHGATMEPEREVWLVLRLHGDIGRKWIDGLEVARTFGVPLRVEQGSPRLVLPANLMIVALWDAAG